MIFTVFYEYDYETDEELEAHTGAIRAELKTLRVTDPDITISGEIIGIGIFVEPTSIDIEVTDREQAMTLILAALRGAMQGEPVDGT